MLVKLANALGGLYLFGFCVYLLLEMFDFIPQHSFSHWDKVALFWVCLFAIECKFLIIKGK